MAFNNPPGHTEEELWQQILSLSRELQECRACLHYHNTLDYIYDKINMIEKVPATKVLPLCDRGSYYYLVP